MAGISNHYRNACIQAQAGKSLIECVREHSHSGILRTGTRIAERNARNASNELSKYKLITCSCHSILCAIDRAMALLLCNEEG